MKQLVKDGAIPHGRAEDVVPRPCVERTTPWGTPHRPSAPAMRMVATAAPADTQPAPGTVERRLARRAEALWASLPTGASGLPDAADAAQLLAPPYAAHGLLVGLPPHADDPHDESARVLHVGNALAALTAAAPGPGGPLADAPLAARLVRLAAEAAGSGQPIHFDSDFDGDDFNSNRAPQTTAEAGGLVWRAIALPFAATPGTGPTALVIASWRRRLSAAETAALHRELAAAIDWMHSQRPRPQPL